MSRLLRRCRTPWPLVLVFLIFLLPGLHGEEFYGKVTEITDGDTIDVLRDGREVTIRLYGIDCPEKSQSFGQDARSFTSEMVFGRRVRVKVTDVDRYGRVVGLVSLEGESEEFVLTMPLWRPD